MTRKSTTKKARRKRAGNALVVAKPHLSDEEYRVGPGCPPREFQFKKGQSGNPKGARRKTTSLAPDLKAQLERALSGKVAVMEGERERFMSKAAAGIERLVNAFAEGDRHARRDVIDLAQRLGVDLTAGRSQAIEKALQTPVSTEDQAVLTDFLQRHGKARDDAIEPQSTQSPDLSEQDPHGG
jgi:Family of unknown function (DUF5681)